MTASTIQFSDSDFTKEIVRQLRALDTHGEKDREPPEKLLEPFLMTKERQREIPVSCDADEEVIERVKTYYNAIASLIERATGLMPVPIVNLHHEGFGRVLITAGKLVVFEKTVRDVQRFGFPSLETMQEEAGTIVTKALALIEKYREVAEM